MHCPKCKSSNIKMISVVNEQVIIEEDSVECICNDCKFEFIYVWI